MARFWGILGRYALVWLVYLLALLLATSLFPGLYVDTTAPNWWVVVLIVPIEFAVLVILLRPLLLFLTLPLNAFTLGLPSLLFNALILKLTADVNSSLVVASYPEAFLGTVVMTTVATSVIGWLGLDEAYPLLQTVLYRSVGAGVRARCPAPGGACSSCRSMDSRPVRSCARSRADGCPRSRRCSRGGRIACTAGRAACPPTRPPCSRGCSTARATTCRATAGSTATPRSSR